MPIWDKMNQAIMPDASMISDYVRNQIWDELYQYLIETYACKPTFEFSHCVWPGWNIKFKKAGKNLCTVYPFEGYLWVLVVVGKQDKATFEAALPSLGQSMQSLYHATEEGNGQRWLRIEAEDKEQLPDIKRCIALKLGR